MPHMYILKCSDESFYVGSTWHLERRIKQHNDGKGANYTKKRLPVKLVYCEYFSNIFDAYRREKQIQKWKTVKKTALVEGNELKLHDLSKCINDTNYQLKPK